MTVLEMMTVVTLPSGRVWTVVDTVETDVAASGEVEIVEVGSGAVVDGMVDDGPRRESTKLVNKSPNDELGVLDDVESKGVL